MKLYSNDKMNIKPVFFKLEVLEKYFQNPNYAVFFSGHSGWIDNNVDNHYLNLFSFGYSYEDYNERVIATFQYELSQMPDDMQHHWRSHQLSNTANYYLHDLFIEENINAQFIDKIPIYTALLMEISCINKLCDKIGIPNMFNNEYPYDDIGKRPDDYHVILLPTYKNYHSFVNVLEKIVVTNLNYDCFQMPAEKIKKIERKNEKDELKGSLQMLIEWLSVNIHNTNCDICKVIKKPLQILRNERQIPAHKIISNKYEFLVWDMQEKLLTDVYEAIRSIRILLINHPKCKDIKIPDEIFYGDNIYFV